MVEAMGLGLFLYRPVAWCFLRGVKYLSILMVGVALLAGGCGGYSGTKVEYYGDGLKRSETPYVDGKKHGTWIYYHVDGWKTEAPYENGKEHGTVIQYYSDGSKRCETPYVNGNRHGTQIWYWRHGPKKSETPWVDGKKHGTEIDYREDGSKVNETIYENGKFISRKFP